MSTFFAGNSLAAAGTGWKTTLQALCRLAGAGLYLARLQELHAKSRTYHSVKSHICCVTHAEDCQQHPDARNYLDKQSCKSGSGKASCPICLNVDLPDGGRRKFELVHGSITCAQPAGRL